ncbi:MAG TPA: glycosyltransferase family 39 protein [Candidatus Dormibacteraeota bacterium]|jgi:4-amino-4-deoxy-L-arabinose transferase-like glycosyltransferase
MIARRAPRVDVRSPGSSRAETTPALLHVSWWKRNLAILVVLAASAVTLLAWSVVVPAWESADEPTHWEYANYIHDRGALPPYHVLPLAAYEPPLYYALISPLAVDGLRIQQAIGGTGVRAVIAPANDLVDNAALHLARLATVLISLVTVLFVYLAAREATGRRTTGVLAAVLVGLWPEFAFRGMTVSPDALVAMAGAIATYLIVRGVRRGFSTRLSVLAGLVIGVAILSKLTGPALLAGAGVAILIERGTGIRQRLGRLAPLLLAPAMIAPWLLYNQLNYGAPYAKIGATLVAAGPVHVHSLLSAYFLVSFPGRLILSSIGLFGWSNIPLPPLLDAAYGLVLAAALVGLYATLRRDSASRPLVAAMLSIVAASVAGAVVVNLTYEQPVGRYLFPAVGAMGVLGAMGLEHLPRWREHERGATKVLFAVMCTLQVIILATVVYPAYASTG